MREFVTAVKEHEADDGGIPFKIDDRECVAYPPDEAQIAVLMATVSRTSDFQSQVAGIINFFVEVVDADSHAYIVSRLMDRDDPFGLEEVKSIMEWMVEEWTGRPIQPPSASTPSAQNGGRKSPPRTRKSTSSASAQAGS